MSFRAGELRETIEVLRHAEGQADAYGRRTETWTRVCALPAAVRDVSAREFYEAAAHQMEDVVTFTVRESAYYVTNADRLRFRGQVYEVIMVNHVGYRGNFQTIKARLVKPEGV